MILSIKQEKPAVFFENRIKKAFLQLLIANAS